VTLPLSLCLSSPPFFWVYGRSRYFGVRTAHPGQKTSPFRFQIDLLSRQPWTLFNPFRFGTAVFTPLMHLTRPCPYTYTRLREGHSRFSFQFHLFCWFIRFPFCIDLSPSLEILPPTSISPRLSIVADRRHWYRARREYSRIQPKGVSLLCLPL